jgi:hypothetical protein
VLAYSLPYPDPPEISDEDWAAELLGKVSSWLVIIF